MLQYTSYFAFLLNENRREKKKKEKEKNLKRRKD